MGQRHLGLWNRRPERNRWNKHQNECEVPGMPVLLRGKQAKFVWVFTQTLSLWITLKSQSCFHTSRQLNYFFPMDQEKDTELVCSWKCLFPLQIYCSSPRPNFNLALSSSRVGYHILTSHAVLEKVRVGITEWKFLLLSSRQLAQLSLGGTVWRV